MYVFRIFQPFGVCGALQQAFRIFPIMRSLVDQKWRVLKSNLLLKWQLNISAATKDSEVVLQGEELNESFISHNCKTPCSSLENGFRFHLERFAFVLPYTASYFMLQPSGGYV